MGDFVVVVGSWRTLCVLLTFCVGCTAFAEIRYAHNELILAHSSLLLYFCGWQQTCSRCANIFVEAEQSWAQMTLQASCLSSCQAWHEHHSIHHHCLHHYRHHHHHVSWNCMDFSLQCLDDDLDDAFGWWAHVTNNIFTAYWLWHKLFSLSLAFEFSPKTTHLSTIFCEKYIDVEEDSYWGPFFWARKA